MKLIDNWKEGWKMWSIRINVLIGLFITGLSQFPDVFMHIWLMVPDTIRDKMIDIENTTTWFLVAIIASTVARLIQQDKLHEKKEDKESKDEGE